MDADRETVKAGALVGVLLAGFFVAGFAAQSLVSPSTPTGQVTSGGDAQQPDAVSQEEAIERATQTLASGPLSYPFTYNISTVSVSNDTRIPGTTFYNWELSYTVEANPFSGALYSVPGNETSTVKSLNLYVSQDGNYMFQNPPIETASRQQGSSGTGIR